MAGQPERLEGLWLSRQGNGLYMLTKWKPIPDQMPDGTRDLYVVSGDPIGYRNMCSRATERIWGVRLKRLESIQVWLQGGQSTNS